MSTITKEQAQKIIEAADEVITALAGTNEDVHPESDSMLRLWDDLNDRYAPPEVVRELARIALASLEAEAVGTFRKGPCGYSPSFHEDAVPLYTAPPAPVVPEEMPKGLAGQIVSLLAHNIGDKFLAQKIWNACRAAMLQGAEPVTTAYKLRDAVETIRNSGIEIDAEKIFAERDALNAPDCWCRTCRPITLTDMRFVVCPECGNKRCPHANDHRNACTGSNEPGQEGSAYPAAPQQEVS
ncbi:hypothetical protein [Enterobacter bugandensis]|uniref:hypothetical protein n=1 Tax=Enterobacter bugandensis TaxID=881260 RepID=UPI0021BD7D8D|nr:hypothetical protein [Enterobacter bugandensis]